MAGLGAAQSLELVKRAGVDLDTEREQLSEVRRKLLSGKTDAGWLKSSSHGTAHLPPGGSVDMEPFAVENTEDGRARTGLHCEPHGQTEGIGEAQHGIGLSLEALLRIDIAWRSMLGGDATGLLRNKER